MSNAALINRLLAQRESWVDLPGAAGARVCVRRPDAAAMPSFRRGATTLDDTLACVVRWDGVTEATLLGAALGGDAAVPFDAELWTTAARDRIDWCEAVAGRVVEMISTWLESAAAARKN